MSFEFQPKSSIENRSPPFLCCYGPFRTHVEKGAFAIAFFGLTLNVIEAIATFFSIHATHYSDNPATGIVFLLGALVYLSIIVAQHKRNHMLYLPYLILTAIGLIVGLLITICVLIVGIANGKASIIGGALVCAMSLALNAWFYSVIFRAYKFMRQQESNMQTIPPPI